MIRKLILTLMVLALAALPIPAWPGTVGMTAGMRFAAATSGSSISIGPSSASMRTLIRTTLTLRRPAYWGPNQPYIDQYGFERFQPVWVPGQWVCY